MKRSLVSAALVAAIVSSAVIMTAAKRSAEEQARRARGKVDDGVTRAVILGDSVARGAGDEHGSGIAGPLAEELKLRGFPAGEVLNFGLNGARTRHVLQLLSQPKIQSAIRSADIVIVSIGGNDLYGDSRARVWASVAPEYHQDSTARKVAMLLSNLRRLNPAARVYLLGLYNPYKRSDIGEWLDHQINRWDSRLIRRFSRWRQVTVVRVMDLLARSDRLSTLDQFHPGSKGYTAIANRIASSI